MPITKQIAGKWVLKLGVSYRLPANQEALGILVELFRDLSVDEEHAKRATGDLIDAADQSNGFKPEGPDANAIRAALKRYSPAPRSSLGCDVCQPSTARLSEIEADRVLRLNAGPGFLAVRRKHWDRTAGKAYEVTAVQPCSCHAVHTANQQGSQDGFFKRTGRWTE